jgi:hypothetical protein
MNHINDAKKFVWAYLLENGHETTGKWNYYAGNWESIERTPYQYGYDYHADFLAQVKLIGVDWDKTAEPEGSNEYTFEGTFSPSSRCEVLIGTIVLKDGTSYLIGCKDNDNMNLYIEKLTKLMKDQERVSNIFGE